MIGLKLNAGERGKVHKLPTHRKNGREMADLPSKDVFVQISDSEKYCSLMAMLLDRIMESEQYQQLPRDSR